MVAFKIRVLVLSLKDGFPNRSVVGKSGKVNLETWRSFLLKLLMRVHLSLRKQEYWRRKWKKDSTLIRQLQSIAKISRHSLVTNLVLMFWHLKKLFESSLINFRMLQRYKLKVLLYVKTWSRLFHSTVVNG